MISTILGINLGEINIPAQIVMVCAFAVMTSSFWFKKRSTILKLQILSNALFAVQYILLEATTGAILSFICIGRAYMFGLKHSEEIEGKNKFIVHMKKNFILYAFVIAYVVASLLMWEGSKGLFALAATLIFTFGLWADKPQNIRISSNIAAFFWFTYNFIVGAYVGCITETIMFISNTIAIVKNWNKSVDGIKVADKVSNTVSKVAMKNSKKKVSL